MVAFFLVSLFLAGCSEQTDWVHRGEWDYVNESSHTLRLDGVIYCTKPQSIWDIRSFGIEKGEVFRVEIWSGGSKHVPPEVLSCPFIPDIEADEKECSVSIDGGEAVPVTVGTFFRNRDNYRVEKVGRSHYRFTYVYTDENIAEILHDNEP